MMEAAMTNAREVLEIMRGVAKSRIEMLNDGITFYDDEKRNYYRSEYGKKLDAINRLIRRFSLQLVHSKESLESKND